MLFTHLKFRGIKGRAFDGRLGGTNIALLGPMGSGKSAWIDAMRLALMLPTQHGAKNLDRISPSGSWRVELTCEHPEYRRLERGVDGSKSLYMVNGLGVTRDEYDAACRAILPVQPHHVDLDVFIGLSAQKRAAMFGELLGKAEPAGSLDEVLGLSVDAAMRLPRMDTSGVVENLRRFHGTVTEAVEFLMGFVASYAKMERDAKVNLEAIADRAVTVSHGMTLDQVRELVRQNDEATGRLHAEKEQVDVQRTRFNSAKESVDKTAKARSECVERIASLQGELDRIQRLLATHQLELGGMRPLEEIRKEMEALRAILDSVAAAKEQRAAMAKCQAEIDVMQSRIKAMRTGIEHLPTDADVAVYEEALREATDEAAAAAAVVRAARDDIQAMEKRLSDLRIVHGAVPLVRQHVEACAESAASVRWLHERFVRLLQDVGVEASALGPGDGAVGKFTDAVMDVVVHACCGDGADGQEAVDRLVGQIRDANEKLQDYDQASFEQNIEHNQCQVRTNVARENAKRRKDTEAEIARLLDELAVAEKKYKDDFSSATPPMSTESHEELVSALNTLIESDRARQNLETHIEQAKRAVASMSGEIERESRRADELEALRTQLEASANAMAPPVDTSILDADLARLENERQDLVRKIRECESVNALAGQKEAGRLDVAFCGAVKKAVSSLQVRADERRAKSIRDAMDRVIGPFQQNVSVMFGGNVQLTHESSGTGRGAEFDFYLVRDGHKVPLDLLSAGETCLVAIGFLAALQRVDVVGNTFVSLNAEGVDDRGLELLLDGVPAMGLSCCVVANNRMAVGNFSGRPEWCAIRVGVS